MTSDEIPDGELAQVTYETYEYVVACKTCGVVDQTELTRDEARSETVTPIDNDPAKLHYDRSGHTVARLNYTTAPVDIREMLDGGTPEDINWRRVSEWLSADHNSAE